MTNRYPDDQLGEYQEDDGTMPENVDKLRQHVVGHRIVSAEKGTVRVPYTSYGTFRPHDAHGFIITLDNGEKVLLKDTSDCCAYTSLESFLLHPDRVDHIITGVGTTDGYERWHIYADMGDVLELEVGWSCGNPFYYGYGFDIQVAPIDGEIIEDQQSLPGAPRAITAG
ncbi:hypothetical protein MINTMi27_15610 [Mycobacterium intracellulare]|uniref:DUF7448 domain-containing protein n=1 Tax=Mycobacterium intracellulare TaxID=1767 RepID=UPI0019294ACD|nr:hypothetical protein [Mycobacterium intracellulare]BCP41468.1 hypothetical protein MINTMi27_15610 [Mycobacterium intracellulare]